MNKYLFFILLLFLSVNICAQFEQGRLELSVSGSLGTFSNIYKSGDYISNSESRFYFTTTLRTGFFIFDSFQIEPELFVYLVEKNLPTYSVNANLAYNFSFHKSNIKPFVLLGYGLGNSYPFLLSSGSLMRVKNEFDIGCINAGVGVKTLVSENVAIRIEYRYQRYDYKEEKKSINSPGNEYVLNIHKVLFGVSFFL